MGVMEIRVWKGDITTLEIDAIVNAANSSLARGSGVCGAIFGAAGPRLDDACRTIGTCGTGDAVATPGFDLTSRWVIHAVGPVWRGGEHGEADDLASCYARIIAVADEVGARTVAIPAISTGVYGYPPAEAAEIAITTLRAADPASIDEVVLVAFDDVTEQRYRNLLDAEG